MVVVEFPLWVTHSAENPTTGASAHVAQSREARALSLLQTRKSALYGVDCHPDGTRFATAGGDGTVRIWSTQPLFHCKHRGKVVVAASGTEPKKSSEDQLNETNLTTATKDTTTSFVSSSSSSSGSDDEDTMSPMTGHGLNVNHQTANSGSSDDEEPIHDLNNLVRRKQDNKLSTISSASTSPPKPMPKSPAIARTTSSSQHREPPRLLATLSAHTGSSVLGVRFSSSGKYLASAGDDAVVCIYERSATASAATGNLTGHNHHAHSEHWVRIHCCRGHGLDVVDLAWAPDDSYLVSCSLDSQTPIIVWKMMEQTGSQSNSIIKSPYKVLGRGIHTSTVKGVSFDPAGSYIASSGDDPAVCIWRAYDDWGLEQRVDASSGIFRQWQSIEDSVSLSSQSLFRRISWATDGAFLCSTNSVVKNKHVASTISRERWNVSSGSHTSTGAANLVGHKQPVVVSRHAPQMLSAKKRRGGEGKDNVDESVCHADDEDEDLEEPQHAMLLALGDKRGFVTVWSTKKSRPIFKLQCSESRCTVTDLSWLKLPANDDLILMISLLDGNLAAVRFSVPNEIGPLLSKKAQARVFELRYGMDTEGGSFLVRRSTGLKMIENPLQMTLEDRSTHQADDDDIMLDVEPEDHLTEQVKARQKESNVRGKKRIQPLLVSTTAPPEKRPLLQEPQEKRDSLDPIQNALNAAERASSNVQPIARQKESSDELESHGPPKAQASGGGVNVSEPHPSLSAETFISRIPHSTDRIHSIELPVEQNTSPLCETPTSYVAECKNSIKVPVGSVGSSVPCIDITISSNGKVCWKQEITGTSCCAIASSRTFLAIGTTDGTIQLYSTSASLGWMSGMAIRSHPTLIFGTPPVALRLIGDENLQSTDLTMLVVTADGRFAVYTLIPHLKLQLRGSIIPAMTHLALSCSTRVSTPQLSRIQMTESGHLLLLLSLDSSGVPKNGHKLSQSSYESVGGSVQAFVYNVDAELWIRVSDSRFLLSDFYSSLPSQTSNTKQLSQWDDLVRIGSMQSLLKANRRVNADRGAGQRIYDNNEVGNYEITRLHCEDRLACAMSIGASSDFEHWMRMYIRTLTRSGQADALRHVVDMLMPDASRPLEGSNSVCWWMSRAPDILGLDRLALLKSIVIPELGKNRSLQRLTNEIALEISSDLHQ